MAYKKYSFFGDGIDVDYIKWLGQHPQDIQKISLRLLRVCYISGRANERYPMDHPRRIRLDKEKKRLYSMREMRKE